MPTLRVKSLVIALRQFMGPNRFGRTVAILAAGTAGGQVLSLLASPFLTRLYTAAEIGLLGLYLAFLSLASQMVSGRYERFDGLH